MHKKRNDRPLLYRSKSIKQIAEEEVANRKKVSVRAINHASKAGKVVSNLTAALTNVITKISEEDKGPSTNELVEFITNDPVFWAEFRKLITYENVITSMGTQEYLAKFLTERMDEIKEAYIKHEAEKMQPKNRKSAAEGVRRNSSFFRGQKIIATGNRLVTSSKSELRYFRNQSNSAPAPPQKNSMWPAFTTQSVKPKENAGKGIKKNTSKLLFRALSLANESPTMTFTTHDLNCSEKVANNKKNNASWTEVNNIDSFPGNYTGQE